MPDPALRRLEAAPFFAARRDGRAGDHAATVRRAIRRREVLRLGYRDADRDASERRVWPLAVWAFTDGWLFVAWCELRDDFRAFRFDRVASLTATGERFADDPARNLQRYLATKMLSAA